MDACDQEDELRRQFPKLFRHPVRCGVELPPGWRELVKELCTQVESKMDGIRPEYWPVVEQIKEKFGGLRFYVSCGTDEIYKLISIAEGKSFSVCELCGAPGRPVTERGWRSTVCDECRGGREAA